MPEIEDKSRALAILGELLNRVQDVAGHRPSTAEHIRWQKALVTATEKIFGPDSRQAEDVKSLSYDLPIIHESTSDADFIRYSDEGVKSAKGLLDAMIDEVTTYWAENKPQQPELPPSPAPRATSSKSKAKQGVPMSKWKPAGTNLGEGAHAHVQIVTADGANDGRRFALKTLKSNVSPKILDRFYNEIQAVKKLDHPNIVKIVDHSQAGDKSNFYVMEYAEGAKSLRKLITSNTNPFFGDPIRSIQMFVAVLEALKHCHEVGITHRDLSAANLLILPDGAIKLIDFGLCQDDDDGHRHTLTDENVGTPNFLAPECESFSSADHTFQSDLYSAGKVLWCAIANRNAFAREAAVFDGLSMKQLFPDNPTAWHLHHIFEKTIRHMPSDRWATPAEAIKGALQVLHLVRANVMPIEELVANRCPVCRYGTMRAPEGLIPVGGYLLFGQSHPDGIVRMVCNYCGHCHLVYREQQKKILAARQGLN